VSLKKLQAGDNKLNDFKRSNYRKIWTNPALLRHSYDCETLNLNNQSNTGRTQTQQDKNYEREVKILTIVNNHRKKKANQLRILVRGVGATGRNTKGSKTEATIIRKRSFDKAY